MRHLDKSKALAVMQECQRLLWDTRDPWIFWLTRILFKSNSPGGAFEVPAVYVALPKNLSDWPTYPVLTVTGVPYCAALRLEGGTTGIPEPLPMYFKGNSKFWVGRHTLIVPPDDPYLAWDAVSGPLTWKALGCMSANAGKLVDRETQDVIQRSVLLETPRITKTVSPVADANPWPNRTQLLADFQASHGEFLRLGGHWDKKHQMYVRRDGSHL